MLLRKAATLRLYPLRGMTSRRSSLYDSNTRTMARLISMRSVVAALLGGALACAWLACGDVEDTNTVADAGVRTTDAQCPDCGTGFVCVYDAAGGCTATGTCIAEYTGICGSIPDIIYCACDAARVPRDVSGHCTTFDNPEEPVRGPFGTAACLGDQ